MIRRLRSRHRVMILVLTPLLPAILLIALLGRSPVPASALPRELAAPHEVALTPIGSAWMLIDSPKIQARYFAREGESNVAAIALTPSKEPTPPDLLLYWAETAGDSATLPQAAALLGPLQPGEPVKLPASNRGYLILYSLAHRERIGVAELPPIPGRP
jgi:hypothetical protein